MFASVPLCLLPPPNKKQDIPASPSRKRIYPRLYSPAPSHRAHPTPSAHPAPRAPRPPRPPRAPRAIRVLSHQRPPLLFLPLPQQKQDISASPSRKRISPRLYAHFSPAVPLPPSPQPPKPRAPLRAPSYLHPLPAHLVRPSHPVRVPLRPRRASAPFHPAPHTPSAPIRTHPHPSAPLTPSAPPAYLLGYIPPHIRRSPSSSSLYVYRRS